jgi:cell division protein FtsI/penicillin-binding protein 2
MLCNFLIFAIVLGISNQSARQEFPVADQDASPRFGSLFGKPLALVSAALVICALTLLAKAAYLEIWQSDDLLARDALVYASDGIKRPEHNPRLNLLAASIPRGDIYDRNGILLATSNWSEIERRRSEYAQLLSPQTQFGTPAETRHYPFGVATVHLLGDLRTGERFHATNASFVEHDSNRKLQGYDDYHDLAPVVRYRHQRDNPVLRALLQRDRDVHTTLDIKLQLKLIDVFRKHLEKTQKKGAAIVMNPQTGDVLALVSWPLPSDANSGTDALLDRARYGEYPPGSTFKLVTAIAALKLNPGATARTFSCRRLSDGRVGTIIPGWRRPIRDDIGDHVHGTLDMNQAITVSCNAYFAQLGVHAVGAKPLYDTAAVLGINAGSEAQVKEMLPFASYGQGPVVATPMQMARVAATIAAQGSMPQGRWVLDASDGRTAAPASIVPADTATFLANAMHRVVTNGTGRTAMAGLSIPVAGKTGTAQLDRGEPHSWFAGFAPFGAPLQNRIAFAVIVEHGGYGAKAAAPIARELVEAAASVGVISGPQPPAASQ